MVKRNLLIFILLFGITFISFAQTGTWSGKLDVQGSKLSIIFHLDENNPTMDSPNQGVKGIPIQIKKDKTFAISISIPSIGAKYEGLWLAKQIVGTFSQMGNSLPLTLFPGEGKLKRPQTPTAPFPYITEEVSFANGSVILNGTLVLPKGYTDKTPVVIMITGSGIQNRDEEIYEHKPFAVIADALARAGIATLRYDDRGFGNSTMDSNNFTIEDFKNDANAGIKLLCNRFEKVGIMGHSEGGTIALMLASEGKADFIICLAGMVVPGIETLLWQNSLYLATLGFSRETIDAYCSFLANACNAIVNGTPVPSLDNSNLPFLLKQNFKIAVEQLKTNYMKSFLSIDVRPLLGRVKCPVLALNGNKDTQVEAYSNTEALKNGMIDNPQNHFETIDGVNHLFQYCITGASSEYVEIEETFSPNVLSMIVEWLYKLDNN